MSSGNLTFHRRWMGGEEIVPTDFRWNGQPLVVLNLNDTSYRRVVEVLREKGLDLIADMIAEQITPRPEEPQGLGAVVEDLHGRRYQRTGHESHPWLRSDISIDAALDWRTFDEISAVRVLSEGVRP